MYSKSTLSRSDGVSAVELFEQGFTANRSSCLLTLPRLRSKCCTSDGNCEDRGLW
jgi:hypothetical protein